MAFDTLDVAHQLIPSLRRAAVALTSRDPDLARQLRRAASSVPLNVAEGRRRAGKDSAHLYRVAAGSAAEVASILRVAADWGHVDAADTAEALALLDRLRAMLWRLTH
jgi:four helix bundle protein